MSAPLADLVAGYVQVLPDEGMPHHHSGGFGNLYVRYEVILPSKLDAGARQSPYRRGRASGPRVRR